MVAEAHEEEENNFPAVLFLLPGSCLGVYTPWLQPCLWRQEPGNNAAKPPHKQLSHKSYGSYRSHKTHETYRTHRTYVILSRLYLGIVSGHVTRPQAPNPFACRAKPWRRPAQLFKSWPSKTRYLIHHIKHHQRRPMKQPIVGRVEERNPTNWSSSL